MKTRDEDQGVAQRLRCVAMSVTVGGLGRQAQDAPKYSNEFLAVGVGARALGMGNAYTAW
jgi:hypothetical protein